MGVFLNRPLSGRFPCLPCSLDHLFEALPSAGGSLAATLVRAPLGCSLSWALPGGPSLAPALPEGLRFRILVVKACFGGWGSLGLERPEGTWEGSLVVGLPLLSPGGHLRPCRQLVTEIAGKR